MVEGLTFELSLLGLVSAALDLGLRLEGLSLVSAQLVPHVAQQAIEAGKVQLRVGLLHLLALGAREEEEGRLGLLWPLLLLFLIILVLLLLLFLFLLLFSLLSLFLLLLLLLLIATDSTPNQHTNKRPFKAAQQGCPTNLCFFIVTG